MPSPQPQPKSVGAASARDRAISALTTAGSHLEAWVVSGRSAEWIEQRLVEAERSARRRVQGVPRRQRDDLAREVEALAGDLRARAAALMPQGVHLVTGSQPSAAGSVVATTRSTSDDFYAIADSIRRPPRDAVGADMGADSASFNQRREKAFSDVRRLDAAVSDVRQAKAKVDARDLRSLATVVRRAVFTAESFRRADPRSSSVVGIPKAFERLATDLVALYAVPADQSVGLEELARLVEADGLASTRDALGARKQRIAAIRAAIALTHLRTVARGRREDEELLALAGRLFG